MFIYEWFSPTMFVFLNLALSSVNNSQNQSIVSVSCCSFIGSQGFDKLERQNGDPIGRENGLLHGPVQKREIFCSAVGGACIYGGYALEGSHAHAGEEKLGVLLLNLGGPETLQDVQPFLFNLFADPDIIRLPRLFRFLQRPLAQLISVSRAPKSKEGYAAIGGGSPLRKITDEQIDHARAES
ncbi:hypothetical protein MKW98_026821 [Papaver atlanticum]|uniref:Ferrochelatase n=1 Tax=Papaver atlanticum TaxID=357466 RepID=A0AAD4S0D9_9MAGN|nr:hypothetical protein MKW98_026821 [Papaver atlanticum]